MGPELARKFAALDVREPHDLLALYPRDYKDWRVPQPLGEIARETLARAREPASADSSEVVAVGRVVRVEEARGRVPVVTAELEDPSGRLRATWFGRRNLAGKLAADDRLFVHARAALRRSRGTVAVELNVLQHRRLDPGEPYEGAIVPVYRATKELPSRAIATVIERNRETLAALLPPDLPAAVLRPLGYGSLRDAWLEAHRPPSPEAAAAARERLAFDEFFRIALDAALRRARRRAEGGARPLPAPGGLHERFVSALPYAPTPAQTRVIGELWHDMAGGAPMNRLLQGDVGSGKTLVAAAAIVLAATHGVQSALMAPTEILAAQHARKLAPLLLPLGVRVDALFGSLSARERDEVRARVASGACELVVGTHALIEDDVTFRDLGLAIIDEQHRFGVAQRARLRAKSRAPHTLHMTATPIPRTLAQTRYADLDLSVLDELPPGRTPVETFVVRASRKPRVYAFVRKSVAAGRQAYVVAPAIDESESALTSALGELEQVRDDAFRGLRVELLHGRLPSREKDAVMTRFARGEADVLLATTVVEVGVDVPNASVMVILDAHRYGLAQLHQLRGRVGRGVAQSYCILIAPDERGDVERLEILARTTDGFVIAEEDLRLRGEGEFGGTVQAGGGALLGSIVSDFALYLRAKRAADALVAADPELARPEHAGLRGRAPVTETRATLLTS